LPGKISSAFAFKSKTGAIQFLKQRFARDRFRVIFQEIESKPVVPLPPLSLGKLTYAGLILLRVGLCHMAMIKPRASSLNAEAASPSYSLVPGADT
jgi:hypothetical protein